MIFDSLGLASFRFVHGNFLVYASCWEDPRVDIQAMQLGPDSRVLVITSAGCNAIDYLLEKPAAVHAVDINYRQNALLELKQAAIAELNWEDFFAVFGKGGHANIRLIYRDRLRTRLSGRSQCYWDRHIGLFSGRLPFYFRTTSGWFALWFRRYIDRVLGLGEEIDALLAADSVEQQREIYDGQIRDRFWRPMLGFVLRRDAALALSAIPPQQRRRIQREHPDLLAYLQTKAEHILYNQPLKENYFWRVYLTGSFSIDCCPRYLQPDHFAALKAGLVDRLSTYTDSVEGRLSKSSEAYTHLVLLDHMDWLAGRGASALIGEWQAIVDDAAPDAKLLWRSFGLGTDFVDQAEVQIKGEQRKIGELLVYDRQLAARLQQQERVNAYASFNVARLTSPAGPGQQL